jgi:hypothetical protein
MCLTTRDHTMQRGACEALSRGRPIITSDWPLLRSHFANAAAYADATPESIARAVREVRDHQAAYAIAAAQVYGARRGEWLARRQRLVELIARPRTPSAAMDAISR